MSNYPVSVIWIGVRGEFPRGKHKYLVKGHKSVLESLWEELSKVGFVNWWLPSDVRYVVGV